jgi:hypothetical protein
LLSNETLSEVPHELRAQHSSQSGYASGDASTKIDD